MRSRNAARSLRGHHAADFWRGGRGRLRSSVMGAAREGAVSARAASVCGRCESVACVCTLATSYGCVQGQPEVLSPGAREGSLRFLTSVVLNARYRL